MKKQRCIKTDFLVEVPDNGKRWYEKSIFNIILKEASFKMIFAMFFMLMSFQQSFAQFKVIGYIPTWGGDLNKVQYSKLTHINYAFMLPTASGGYQAMDETRLKNLISLAHANGVKVIISVGGGGGGDAFRTIVPNAGLRTTFVNNMLTFCNKFSVDGVDIDWEFPNNGTEANNFGLLMQELSAKMHSNGKLCTAAVIAYGGTSFVNSLFTSCDFINIMAYDENSYDHSTYDVGVKSVNYWVGRGLDKNKAVLGVPFYGRDNCCDYKTAGYDEILAMGGSPNADTFNGKIGYNGIPTMKKKTTYAIGACGGIMIWSLDTDVLGVNSLLSAINDVVVANSNPVPDNLAKGKSVTVTSTESSTTTSTVGSNATDGSYNTRWSSTFADPQSITVDLGANYNINRVKLSWESAYATAYQVQISTDNSTWATIKTVSGNTATTNDLTGLSGTCRFLKIVGTARATAYGYSLYEIEAYGTAIESPYSGTAISLPGKIEAENYDLGGEGLAYHDTESANQGGAFRTDGVDVQATTDEGAGYNIGYTANGEWLKYMVNVTAAGTYSFDFRTASTGSTSSIRLEVDGVDVTGNVALPNTGAWQTWATTTVSNVNLTAGAHTIRLFIVTGGFNLNYVNVKSVVPNQLPTVTLTSPVSGTTFTSPASIVITASASDADGTVSKVDFYNGTTLIGTDATSPYSITWTNVATGTYSITAKATDNSVASTTSSSVSVVVNAPVIVETPYGGTAANIPGTVQAENYNNGGEGLAYHDIDVANQGGAYRTTEGVDVQTTTDVGGGYNIGYTADGEWMNYIVNVTAAGSYDVSFRTAATSASGVLKMLVDGNDVTGNVALPNTGAWQSFATTTIPNVTFSAGAHMIRISVVTGGFNLNSFSVITHVVNTTSYLRASGKNIVNNNGNYQIKAINLGNYMVQEGYMLNLGGGYQWNVKNKIADVVGVANRDKFYDDYLDAFITKADIDSIAKWGFNSIRLPMHYNLFTPLGQQGVYIEKGFARVDQILEWCKANNLYLILDLHAAPGGQSSGDISDYIAGQPSLWESAANRSQTVALWKKFAERYVNETSIGGYDLINETNWTLANNNQLLMQLMKDITAAIRQVDNNHLIFVEGNSYANDYNGLTPKWDNNMAYSFHKYWNDNVQGALNFALAIRDGQNVPIWLGEFGENSNHWIAEAVSLMNNNNIGWAIWPYKKMGSISGASSFKEPNNWSALANYINGGAKPSAAVGQAILNELVQNVKVANCTVNKGYIYALIEQPGNNNTKPYANVSLPGKVMASKYDEGKNGYAYSDAVYQTSQFGSGGGSYTAWNTAWYGRNDGVDIQFSTAENAPTVGYISNNEWMKYTVNVSTTGTYTVKARVAGNGGTISMSADGTILINNVTVVSTAGWDAWQTVTLGNVNLSAGQHALRFTMNTAGYNLSYFEFTTNAPVNQAPVVSLTSPVNNASAIAPATFTIAANASDADGTVSKVEFYNGTTLLATSTSSPYSYNWTGVAAGTYALTAKVTDNAGATTVSSVVNVTVTALPVCLPASASSDDGNVAANVLDNDLNTRWSANGDGQYIQFCLASAQDVSGLQIAFYSGDVRQSKFDVQASQDGLAWTNVLTNLSSSGTTLALEQFTFATQSAQYVRILGHGNTVNTWNSITEVKILTGTVTPPVNQAPTVSLTSPANNAAYNAPASITITATAADADGTVSKVEFYNGTTLLGTDVSSPYTYTWSNVAAGTYSIIAKATDNLGATKTSAAVSVKVNTVVVNDPCAGIASYVENAGYVEGSKVKASGSQYQCKPYPYAGWCNGAAWAYGPGTGAYWADAWTLIGTCTSGARSSTSASAANVSESLVTNAPNPFAGSTNIEIVVLEAGDVSVMVYNKTGQVVGSVVEGYLSAGTHNYTFDAANLKADMYIIKMNTNNQVITRKMVKSE